MDELYQEAMKKGIEVVLENYVDPLLHKIGDKIRGAAKAAAREISVDTNLAFREYLKKAFDSCSKIKTVLYRREPKYLYDFFEVPSVQKIGNFRGEMLKRKANTLDDVLSLANESHFIILRGTGGIGKSTLMKHLFLDELSRKDLIPVYLQLQSLNEMKGELDFQRFILEFLRRFGCELDEETLEYALQSGCFLFLLDGYDEVLSNHSGQFFYKLEAFCDRYADNYFIVSSRPRKESDFLGGSRFTVLEACPFTIEEATSLVRKIGYAPDVRDRFIEALKAGMYEKHKTFASNPLLLTVMLIMFDDYADIPEKLHLFYEEAFLSMYMKHDATKGGNYRRERKSGVRDYDDFRMIFACFCFISYANGETEFSWDRLAEIFRQVQDMDFCKSAFSIEAYVDDLMEGLCVLYQDGSRYLFTHRSFQEYFTAVFLMRQSDEHMTNLSLQLIENDVERAIRDEVFRLIKGMDEDKFWNNVIFPILREFERGLSDAHQTDEKRFSYYLGNLCSVMRLGSLENLHDFLFEDGIYLYRDFHNFDLEDISFGFKQKSPQDKVWFAYHFYDKKPRYYHIIDARIIQYRTDSKMTAEDAVLVFYLREQPRYQYTHSVYGIRRKIPVSEILRDPEALRLTMATPSGQLILNFSRLRGQIEARKKRRSVNLSSLMKKKE